MKNMYEFNHEVHKLMLERIPLAFDAMEEQLDVVKPYIKMRLRTMASLVTEMLDRDPRITVEAAVGMVQAAFEATGAGLQIIAKQSAAELLETDGPSVVADFQRHD